MDLTAPIKKLVAIRAAGQLGDLLAHFSVALREAEDPAPIDEVHARLDAEEVGRAAAHLLDVDEVEATAMALDAISLDTRRAIAIDLIAQFAGQNEVDAKLSRERRRA